MSSKLKVLSISNTHKSHFLFSFDIKLYFPRRIQNLVDIVNTNYSIGLIQNLAGKALKSAPLKIRYPTKTDLQCMLLENNSLLGIQRQSKYDTPLSTIYVERVKGD